MVKTIKDEYVNSLLALTGNFEKATGINILSIRFERISNKESGQVSESSCIREIILEMK